MKKGMKGILSFLLIFMLCAGLFAIFGTNTVKAVEDDIASGTSGTCSWVIDANGVLTISPTNGVNGTLANIGGEYLQPWKAYANSVTSVVVSSGVNANEYANGLFYNLKNCVSIDLSGLNTSNTTNFRNTFHGCSKLTRIEGLSNLDVSKVTKMSGMFSSCSSLTSIDLSSWDMSSVRDVARDGVQTSGNTWGGNDSNGMFNHCSGATSILLPASFDVSKLNSLNHMFGSCAKLQSLDVSGWNTKNIQDMSYLFYNCRLLEELAVSNWDTSNVTKMQSVFEGCYALETIDLTQWDTKYVTIMRDMLANCIKLFSVELGANYSFKGNNITNTINQAMLSTPPSATTTGKWIREDGKYGPYTPVELRDNYTSEMAGTWIWEIKDLAYAVLDRETGTFSFVRAKEVHNNNSTGTVHSISGGEYTGTIFTVNETSSGSSKPWSSIASQVKKVQFVDEIKPKNTQQWFQNFTNCTEMDLKKLNVSNVTTMMGMFENCASLTSLDLSGWNTSNVTDMSYMFRYLKSMERFVVPFNTENVTAFGSMFYGCSNLKYLDIQSFDTNKAHGVQWFLSDASNLEEIVIGENFNFKGDGSVKISFPIPKTASKKWVLKDDVTGETAMTVGEMSDADYVSAGSWVWQPPQYSIVFKAPDGAIGSMVSISSSPASVLVLPANQFAVFGYDFDHWDDGKGHTYIDQATIPANTYAADSTVTLTAVFKKRDTSVQMEDGTFTFDIKAGEKATFKDIPAGTSYQVYELTPDGWVLVQQENASGVIDALTESAASFWNQYQPGVTTVQFSGLKTLDGHPASEGVYTFELLENGKVIDTATTQDGGFIQFKVIEYDAAGDHTYTIREVEPDDDSIDYDTHEETVNVKVTDDGAGNLSSEVTYDEDGIKFENHTRPGILRITKNADVTEANKDDTFTFEITFSNENGMPISDNIYWYVEN